MKAFLPYSLASVYRFFPLPTPSQINVFEDPKDGRCAHRKTYIILWLFLVSGLPIAGCNLKSTEESKTAIPPSPPVVIDVTTPDKALKSYWMTKEELRASQTLYFNKQQNAITKLESKLNLVTTADMFHDLGFRFADPETFNRDIIDVKVESDSRAVIVALIKNTTPIPAEAENSAHFIRRRRDGDRYKYVLEKEGERWRVAEVWSWETYPAPDWKKILPLDRRKSFPWTTFGGY